MTEPLRLGVNIDHVATIRNARGGLHPDPIRAALLAEKAGADGITVHLREDRRHIIDSDLPELMEKLTKPLNLEMAVTNEMLAIALEYCPNACCLVPEKREELTTEGGLDVLKYKDKLIPFVQELRQAGIRVSLFIDANEPQIECSAAVGADIVELHTGTYCHAAVDRATETYKEMRKDPQQDTRQDELTKLIKGAELASELGLEVHAGHGLNFETVGPVAEIPQIVELNIGHFLVGEAIYVGLEVAIQNMRSCMDAARKVA